MGTVGEAPPIPIQDICPQGSPPALCPPLPTPRAPAPVAAVAYLWLLVLAQGSSQGREPTCQVPAALQMEPSPESSSSMGGSPSLPIPLDQCWQPQVSCEEGVGKQGLIWASCGSNPGQ